MTGFLENGFVNPTVEVRRQRLREAIDIVGKLDSCHSPALYYKLTNAGIGFNIWEAEATSVLRGTLTALELLQSDPALQDCLPGLPDLIKRTRMLIEHAREALALPPATTRGQP